LRTLRVLLSPAFSRVSQPAGFSGDAAAGGGGFEPKILNNGTSCYGSGTMMFLLIVPHFSPPPLAEGWGEGEPAQNHLVPVQKGNL
jgi:hypothetical protein